MHFSNIYTKKCTVLQKPIVCISITQTRLPREQMDGHKHRVIECVLHVWMCVCMNMCMCV